MKFLSPLAKLSVGSGLLFFAHALIPQSNAWPLLWPAIGGAAAVAMSARAGRRVSFWQQAGAAAKVGLGAGTLSFLLTAVSLWLLSTGLFEPVARQLGASGPVVFGPVALLGLAAAALMGTVLAGLAGAAAYPFTKRKQQHG